MDIRPRKRAYLIPLFIALSAITIVIISILNLGTAMASLHDLENSNYTDTLEKGDVIMVMAYYTNFPAEIENTNTEIFFDNSVIQVMEISGDVTIELTSENVSTSINEYYTFATITAVRDSEIEVSQVLGTDNIVIANISPQAMMLDILLIFAGGFGGFVGSVIPVIVISIKRSNAKGRYMQQYGHLQQPYQQPEPKKANNDYDF
jgi:uncharacterized membrane protein SpoIIM required for sporulation